MNLSIPLFDSRDIAYRSPFGAVPEGQAVFFRICLPRSLACSAARLHVRPARGGDEARGMFWAGMNGEDHEWWDCRYTPEQADIYRYWFELDARPAGRILSRLEDGRAALAVPGPAVPWQLTCYERDFVTPDWPAGGIMYQIFPDRFARGGAPGACAAEKPGVPEDRILRDDWGGQPQWRPDERGKIRNNDYFGGDLKGIEQRLDRLAELGVTCLYLNPVFEAHSNHRYDTADYSKIDPLLGSEEDFRSLLRAARSVGIRVLIDGVFSHTGADSVYFNREGRYPGPGAAQSPDSPWSSWYRFSRWPDKYDSWWGFVTLPEVQESDPGFMEYILGENGIVRGRLRDGTAGWRLDVADELPDGFLDALRSAVKAENPDAMVLGEVWEDASNKESYGSLRRYLLGRQLDSVMNYPFRTAIINYLRGGPADAFVNAVMDIVEHYPPQVTRLLMNMLGTHDTERILTALAAPPAAGRGREWQAAQSLSPAERERGLRLLRLAAALQYTLPGMPCIYYGDEAGMEGYRDPFNRGCYPWGGEDAGLLAWFRRLGQLRRACPVLRAGVLLPRYARGGAVAYERVDENGRLLCAVNAGEGGADVPLTAAWTGAAVCMGEGTIHGGVLRLPPLSCAIAVLARDEEES